MDAGQGSPGMARHRSPAMPAGASMVLAPVWQPFQFSCLPVRAVLWFSPLPTLKPGEFLSLLPGLSQLRGRGTK